MNEIRFKYNGDNTYTILATQGDRQILFKKAKLNIKAYMDNDGNYGVMTNDPDYDIAHIDEWDGIIYADIII